MKEYLTNQIRNVALLGHLGSGKTSLSAGSPAGSSPARGDCQLRAAAAVPTGGDRRCAVYGWRHRRSGSGGAGAASGVRQADRGGHPRAGLSQNQRSGDAAGDPPLSRLSCLCAHAGTPHGDLQPQPRAAVSAGTRRQGVCDRAGQHRLQAHRGSPRGDSRAVRSGLSHHAGANARPAGLFTGISKAAPMFGAAFLRSFLGCGYFRKNRSSFS